ncbi:MAG: HAD hydrolase-like protein [Alphaproteobacteria bacterium]|nr:HAD hydrolase-like protein [Alphaproteobacteria bacterium]
MIYNNLTEIADRFVLFLFDAYGVFWEGNGFYPNSREIMHELIAQGKKVVIISNTTMLQKDIIARYTERGLLENYHYDYILTSGDLLRQVLVNQALHFAANPHPIYCYVIGKPHRKAFADTVYQQTDTLAKADFVYCGVPFMYPEDVAAYPQYKTQYLPVQADENGSIAFWDTLTPAPFEKIINEAAALKLPVLNANPDFTAKEGHPLMPARPADFVVRNGMIAEMFRQRGAEVLEFGKPHRNIYDFVFTKLQEKGIAVNKARTCMIGDTVRTDVKGALEAEVTPILCIGTGVTAEEISNGNTVENLCLNENIDVQQIIQIESVGGKI